MNILVPDISIAEKVLRAAVERLRPRLSVVTGRLAGE